MAEVANQKLATEVRDIRGGNEELLKKLNELSAQLQKKDGELLEVLTRYPMFVIHLIRLLFKSCF